MDREGILVTRCRARNLRLLPGIHRPRRHRAPHAQRDSSPSGASRTIPPASFFATNRRSPARKSTASNCLRHTRTHTGQLFMLYNDPQRRVDALLEADCGRFRARRGSKDEYARDSSSVAGFRSRRDRRRLCTRMARAKTRHRRWTSPLRDCAGISQRTPRRRAAPATCKRPTKKSMMTFFNTRGEGLLILPTHRVVANLPGIQSAALSGKKIAPYIRRSRTYSFGSESARAAAYDRISPATCRPQDAMAGP